MEGFDATNQQRILFIGDSKTLVDFNTWPATLVATINGLAAPSPQYSGDNIGAGATTAGFWATNIDTRLALDPHADKDNHVIVPYSIGVNDFGTATEAQWIADVETVADVVHARWPAALFYISRPWKRGFDATADTYAGWIATILAARSFCRSGDDERVWLKGSDDGATNTTDGVHYSAAGQIEKAAQMKALLGY